MGKHVGELTKRSIQRSKSLEEAILQMSSQDLGTIPGRIFLATVDLQTDLYYAPLTNTPREELLDLIGREDPVIESIRNNFPVSVGGTGLLRHLIDQYGGMNDAVVFVELDDTGAPLGLHLFSSSGPLLEAPPLALPGGLRVADAVNRGLERLRPPGQASRKHLFLRVDRMIPDPSGRKLHLVQVGSLFLEASKPLLEAVPGVRYAVQASSFATLVLLYEKERYFQKSLRQAVSGAILKYGPGGDISSQVRVLRTLSDNGRYSVPEVLEEDPEMGAGGAHKPDGPQFAWYKMNRLTPATLLDLFVRTGGLRNYEVDTLTRACFTHLKGTYWLDDFNTAEADTRASLAACLAICLERVRQCCESIASRVAAVDTGRPVKFARSIDIFERRHIGLLKALLPHVDQAKRRPMRIAVRPSGFLGLPPVAGPCDHPLAVLEKIRASAQRLEGLEPQFTLQKGQLHGDSHFGNFLVDASVPEDPLVFSIDPATLSKPAASTLALHVAGLTNENALERAVTLLFHDVTYDVAKMMMSTVCGYGLAYRGAFTPKGAKGSFTLEQVGPNEVRKLSDVGGISGSQIVAIDAPVAGDAFRYHEIAGGVVFREFATLCRAKHLGPRGANLAFVRLCLLTARHAFSIAEILFPRDVPAAITMFLLADIFLNRAERPMVRALESGLSEPKEEDWATAFSLGGGAEEYRRDSKPAAPEAHEPSMRSSV